MIEPSDSLRTITFVDVGQGDCTLVIDRVRSAALLIDCTAKAARQILRRLKADEIQQVDVIITHWDADHYAGAARVAKNYSGTRRIHFNHDTARPADPEQAIRRERALRSIAGLIESDLQPAHEGVVGLVGDIRWQIIAPNYRELTEALVANDRNHASAIVYIVAESTSVLVGGDADGRIWQRLATSGDLPRAGVLRCSHHGGSIGVGSAYLTEDELYNAVRPDTVVISTGTNNAYGHPFNATIDRARAAGLRVMCTQATSKCAATGTDRSCAGDITLCVDSGRMYPTPEDHALAMAALTPLCRP